VGAFMKRPVKLPTRPENAILVSDTHPVSARRPQAANRFARERVSEESSSSKFFLDDISELAHPFLIARSFVVTSWAGAQEAPEERPLWDGFQPPPRARHPLAPPA
jgi:hypothetical protein